MSEERQHNIHILFESCKYKITALYGTPYQ